MDETKVTAEPGQSLIEVTREFAAPRDLVFRAHTEPDLLVQWLGPRNLTMRIDEFDVRHGGAYRYVHTAADGTEHAFRGVFHGTPSPDGIVQTFEYEGMPGHVTLDTLTLEERDGMTVARVVSSFQSVADRDGMLQAGMESGMSEGYEKLDELLERLQAGN